MLSRQLNDIFTQMDEEWVQTGKHFIPLKSGGQINLNADAYPIINLSNGKKVIVDLYNDMPKNMATLITTSWENYRIVHIEIKDDLRKILNKIIPLCDFYKLYGANDPLILGGDIPLRITADWIIQRSPESADKPGTFTILTLVGGAVPRIPKVIQKYLDSLGIQTIEFPSSDETSETDIGQTAPMMSINSKSSLIETLLERSGQRFSTEVDIPIYQSNKTDLNLTIKADFFLNVRGRDCIIDLNGLGADIISLLEEHHFLVLSVPMDENPMVIVTKTLNFIGVKSESKPHAFMAADRNESRNIRLMIQGVSFKNENGQNVFTTPVFLPQEIASFLSQKGYRVLHLRLE